MTLFSCFKQSVVAGLALCGNQFTLVKVKRFTQKIILKGFAVVPIPADLIMDGKIDQSTRMIDIIKRLVEMAHAENCDTAIGLPASFVIRKKIKLPDYLTDKECEAEISGNIERYVPGIHEELNFDYVRLMGQEKNMLLIAARTAQIKSFVTIVEAAGLKVRVVDVDIYALARAMHFAYPSEQVQIIVVVDSVLLQLIVLQQQKIIFSHQFTMSDEESMVEKIEHGLQLFSTATKLFYEKKIFLMGNLKNIAHFKRVVQNELGFHVEVANPFLFIMLAAYLDKQEFYAKAPGLISALGLTMRRYPVL